MLPMTQGFRNPGTLFIIFLLLLIIVQRQTHSYLIYSLAYFKLNMLNHTTHILAIFVQYVSPNSSILMITAVIQLPWYI